MYEEIGRRRKKQSKIRILSLIFVGAGLLVFGAVALLILPMPDLVSDPPAEEPVRDIAPAQMNEEAPDLELVDLSEKNVTLKDYRGKVVLVNNWATWCPPCRAEMPTLEAYYQDHKGEGFVLIGIEAGEPADEVKEFVERYGISFPIWLDPESKALNSFRNMALPSSYVINPDGMIVLAWTGAITLESLEEYVTPMLKE